MQIFRTLGKVHLGEKRNKREERRERKKRNNSVNSGHCVQRRIAHALLSDQQATWQIEYSTVQYLTFYLWLDKYLHKPSVYSDSSKILLIVLNLNFISLGMARHHVCTSWHIENRDVPNNVINKPSNKLESQTKNHCSIYSYRRDENA